MVVANKLDKLKKREISSNLDQIRLDLELTQDCPVIPFSAEKGTGREDCLPVFCRQFRSKTGGGMVASATQLSNGDWRMVCETPLYWTIRPVPLAGLSPGASGLLILPGGQNQA